MCACVCVCVWLGCSLSFMHRINRINFEHSDNVLKCLKVFVVLFIWGGVLFFNILYFLIILHNSQYITFPTQSCPV